MIILSPSILASDFANLERDIRSVADAGAQYIHVDVMDGHFVPNITIGSCVVESIRKITDKVLDVHLMISDPLAYAEAFLRAGADIITVHHECNPDIEKIYRLTQKYNRKLCVSINPDTPYQVVEKYIDYIDMILVMSVHPGFGGQSFIESSIDKIRNLRMMYPDIDIEVDGGIKLSNLNKVTEAGANVIVAGSAVFASDNITETVNQFLKG